MVEAFGTPKSMRFNAVVSCLMAIPPKQREDLLFGRHRLAPVLQKVVNRLTGYRGPARYRLGGDFDCEFESTVLQKYFYLREYCSTEEQQFIRKCVEPGMLVFDVGAHLGFMTLLFSTLGARVVAFEPSPTNYPLLLRNLSLNPHRRIVAAVNAGASDVAGESRMIDRGSMSKLRPEGDLVVRLVRLDDAAAEYGWPDFVKVDVEGHAAQVLRGAQRVLERKPKMIIELHNSTEEQGMLRELTGRYDLLCLDTERRFPKRVGIAWR